MSPQLSPSLALFAPAGLLFVAIGAYALRFPRKVGVYSDVTNNRSIWSGDYRHEMPEENVTAYQVQGVQLVGIAFVVGGVFFTTFLVAAGAGLPFVPLATNGAVLALAGAAAVTVFALEENRKLAAVVVALAGVGVLLGALASLPFA